MERRNFLRRGLTVAGAASVGGSAVALGQTKNKKTDAAAKPGFKLAYAPHFGMFENSAGKDLISQLRFMADNGFTALEDNGMMGRTPQVQEQIGKELTRLGMQMGVFVVGFDNWPPQTTLASGKSEWKDKFLGACRTAIDVAKRVNAKWMTVVPGNFERTLPMGIQTANVIESLRRALTTTYRFGKGDTRKHDLNVNLSYQEAADKQGDIIRPGNLSQFYNLGTAYNLLLTPQTISFQTAFHATYNYIGSSSSVTLGPTVGVRAKVFRKKVTTGVSSAYNVSLNGEATQGKVLNLRLNTGYSPWQKHNLNANVMWQNRQLAGKRTTDALTATVAYAYSF